MHKVLKPSYEHFDKRRSSKGIQAIQFLPADQTCPTGVDWEELEIYTWPGTVLGFKDGGKYYRGATDSATVIPQR